MKMREWYFIRKLRDHERVGEAARFEVQVLNDDGQAIDVGYVGEEDEDLVITGRTIPRPVVGAAKKRKEGEGDYVGPDGVSVPPF